MGSTVSDIPSVARQLTLNDLQPELLAHVLDFVVHGSLRPFPNLNLVSHYFNDVANGLLQRRMLLDLDPTKIKSARTKINKTLCDGKVLSSIRSIKIQGGAVIPEYAKVVPVCNDVPMRIQDDTVTLQLLADLIAKAHRLENFEWCHGQSLPPVLVRNLEK